MFGDAIALWTDKSYQFEEGQDLPVDGDSIKDDDDIYFADIYENIMTLIFCAACIEAD